MYVATIPNRGSPPAILLRESYREAGRVKNRTLANLSHWPPARVEALRQVLRGATVVGPLEAAFDLVASRPHGAVAAVLGTVHRLGLPRLLGPQRGRERHLVVAMVVERLLAPRSTLAAARGLDAATAVSTPGEELGLGTEDADALDAALDWLLARQSRIEAALARRHLAEGELVLYDLTSTDFEGRTCPPARLDDRRAGRRDRPQMVVGLVTNAEGCPVAVEVWDGDAGDPATVAAQMERLRTRFGLTRMVLVGDRGVLTSGRIREDLQGVEGLAWLTALRAPALRALVETGALEPSLFDERDLAEIASPAYPGERLIACRNPFLAEERARRRDGLLQATEAELAKIAAATTRRARPLRGQARIALRVGRVLGRYEVGKYVRLTITDEELRYERDQAAIAAEAALDGVSVLRTPVPATYLDAAATVRAYTSLAGVARAFRSLTRVDLTLRPIHHRPAERVRAHVLLCMLAYYVEWHMRRALAPLLFDDDDPAGAAMRRRSSVAPAQRSARAEAKRQTRRTPDGLPLQSFQSLLRTLSALTLLRVQPRAAGLPAFDRLTTPTPLQARAFKLLGVPLRVGSGLYFALPGRQSRRPPRKSRERNAKVKT